MSNPQSQATLEFEKSSFRLSKLHFEPESFSAQYGCMIIFEEDDVINELRYKLNVTFLEQEEFTSTLLVDREPDFFINDKIPNNLNEIIPFEVSSFIYPLVVETNYQGNISRINNFDEIKIRWKKLKNTLNRKYDNAILAKYIKQSENYLRSIQSFEKRIFQDWFLNLYFAPIYTSYSDDLYTFKQIGYPIIKGISPINYQIKQKIIESPKDIRITLNGEIDDPRCALDIEQGSNTPYFSIINPKEKKLKGTNDILYFVNKNSGVIEGYNAVFETSFYIPKKVTIKMFLLEHISTKKSVIIEDETYTTKTKPKKNFFSKLFKG
ncbi:hypothetical protein [Ascidiimonas sp. W6]|uniref:hypothetical protein n=1 Tax=Ascidiimonas meishanensis TaxID=3128903 RepID=UPI0030EF52AD